MSKKFDRKRLRRRLRDIYGDACVFCERVMMFKSPEAPVTFLTATVEHVTPLADGGSHKIGNLRLSCSECNGKRGRRSFLMFLEERRRELGLKPLESPPFRVEYQPPKPPKQGKRPIYIVVADNMCDHETCWATKCRCLCHRPPDDVRY